MVIFARYPWLVEPEDGRRPPLSRSIRPSSPEAEGKFASEQQALQKSFSDGFCNFCNFCNKFCERENPSIAPLRYRH